MEQLIDSEIDTADYFQPSGRLSFEDACIHLYTDMIVYVRRMSGWSSAQATDVVQDAYLRAFLAWDRFQPYSHVPFEVAARAWLYTIVRNTYKNTYNLQKRRREVCLEHRETKTGFYSYDFKYDPREKNGELGDEFLSAIARLSDEYRAAFELHYFLDFSLTEVGNTLGISEGAAKKRVFRARRSIAKSLGRTRQDALQAPQNT